MTSMSIMMSVSLVGSFAIMACTSFNEPSALDLAERQNEIVVKKQEIEPMVQEAKGNKRGILRDNPEYWVVGCKQILLDSERRADTIFNAIVFSGDDTTEIYKLLEEELKRLNQLEQDLKTCLHDSDHGPATTIRDELRQMPSVAATATLESVQQRFENVDNAVASLLKYENTPAHYVGKACDFMRQADYDSSTVHHVMASEWGNFHINEPNTEGVTQAQVVAIISTLEFHLGNIENYCQNRFP